MAWVTRVKQQKSFCHDPGAWAIRNHKAIVMLPAEFPGNEDNWPNVRRWSPNKILPTQLILCSLTHSNSASLKRLLISSRKSQDDDKPWNTVRTNQKWQGEGRSVVSNSASQLKGQDQAKFCRQHDTYNRLMVSNGSCSWVMTKWFLLFYASDSRH